MAYWLFKSEPFKWSWDMQKAKGDVGEEWTVCATIWHATTCVR